MKRWLSLVLVLALGLSLAACGANKENVEPMEVENSGIFEQEGANTLQEEALTENEAETPPPTQEPTPTKEPESVKAKEDSFSLKGTIEETILVDEKGIKITATDLSFGKNAAELSFLIENNTDSDLRFMSGTWGYSCNSINGYMVDTGSVSTNVPSGKKTRETMRFDYDELEIYGIKNIAEIGVGFLVDEADTYKDVLETGPIAIQTSIADSYDFKNERFDANNGIGAVEFNTEEVFFDQNEIKVTSMTLFKNTYDDQYVLMEIENNSDQMIYAKTKSIAIDGIEVCYSTWSSDAVSPGKKAILSIRTSALLDEPEYELLGLTTVNEISFNLEIEDEERETTLASGEICVQIAEKEEWGTRINEAIFADGGVKVYAIGLTKDKYSFSDDVHMFFLIENNTDGMILADVKRNSASIDGFLIDEISFGAYISQGKAGILDVELQGNSLDKNGINGIGEIKSLELTLEIKNEHYREIAQQTVTLEF